VGHVVLLECESSFWQFVTGVPGKRAKYSRRVQGVDRTAFSNVRKLVVKMNRKAYVLLAVHRRHRYLSEY
jgi:hypothetical protein